MASDKEQKTGVLDNCTGLILVGGRSTRFGRDKSHVVLDGRALIDHVAGGLRAVCREVIAVAREEQESECWPVDRVVRDDASLPEGPLRGIVAGLNACETPLAFVASCDSPMLRPGLVRAMVERSAADCAAVVPAWDGHVQPVTALYAASSADRLYILLRDGDPSPTNALKSLRHRVMSEDECRVVDPEGWSFRNLNSETDLVALENDMKCQVER